MNSAPEKSPNGKGRLILRNAVKIQQMVMPEPTKLNILQLTRECMKPLWILS